MKFSRLNIALYICLIFASGVVVGVFANRLYRVSTVQADPREWRQEYVSEMTSRLKLRPEQVTSLNNILDETRSRFHQVHEKMRPEMDSIRQEQTAKIRDMLNDAQRAEYEKMRIERERKLKNQPQRRGGPGHGV
jgi:DNA anti-recombination protein RmuC